MMLSQTEITGAEVHAVQLAEWLKNHGHEVFIMSDTLTVKTQIPYIQRKLHPKGILRRVSNIFFVRKFIKSYEVDVIHTHSRAAVRVAFWARLGTKVGSVSTVHGRQHFSFSKKLFNLYGQHIIAICENLKTHLIKDFGVSKNYITIIGNPVNDQLTFVNPLAKQKKVAIVGRTSGPKGEQTKFLILNVFPETLKKHPDLKIELVGGPLANLGIEAQRRIDELNSEYPGCIKVVHSQSLEKDIENYQLVFAAGRVAISALIRGIPLWAIGEHGSHGLVEPRSFSDNLKSNFGDIGIESKKEKLDPHKLIFQLEEILSRPPLSQEVRQELQHLALLNFGFNSVAQKILNTYKAASLKAHYPRFIPILMYHMVTDEPVNTRHRIFITKDNFDKQLSLFKKWGYETLTFGDLDQFTSGKKPWNQFPEKPLILTFDDGYKNNLTNALPILKKYNFKAVIYLLANHSISSNSWDTGEVPENPLLTPQERQELANSGSFEMASHGLEHKRLTEMSFTEAKRQLENSKVFLENEFKKPILSYAFTYGARRDDLADLAFQAGYQYIVNTDQGGFHLSTPLTSIFRVPIFPEDDGYKLWRKVQPWYRRYFFWTRKK
jgi:peptidoglycan/xylan/chitin deacetylase (PgdA/CDA1 family)/glycosyltransferase involved in cell wall biosynthesis